MSSYILECLSAKNIDMKKFLNKCVQILVLVIPVSFYSCDKFLEEEPYSFLAPENFYQNEDDAFSALVGAYAGLGDQSTTFLARTVPYLMMFTSDECASPTMATQNQLDRFTFNATHSDIDLVWTQMYDAINRANVVINRVGSIIMDETIKQQFIGEARFIRALCYFYGVRFWGGLPLVVNEVTSVEEVSTLSRSPLSDVYRMIIEDLEFASQILPLANQDGRATRGAAKALLAKVYLTRASSEAADSNDYQLCADLSKEIIDMPHYRLVEDYQDAVGPHNKFNTESIFEWNADRTIQEGKHSTFGHFMLPRDILGIYPEAGQAGSSGYVSEVAYFNLYDDRDYRKESTFITHGRNRNGQDIPWTQFTIPFPSPAKKYIHKYGESRNVIGFSANFVVLRLADVYLMRAEALNEISGPTTEAYEMINAIRARARNGNGVSSNSFPVDLSGLTKDEFRDSVLHERAIELGFEGHRWFDLVRTNRMVETIKRANPAFPVSERHMLFPIPADEILINTNIVQNPGW